ncbi:hypothetical protein PFISCL1PPCAC_16407, partial [Pristionchus fissidentatus]
PRYCVFADEKRKLLVSGAGPLIQVYKSDAEEGSYPISTIHVFDRQNVNVEFIQPIENTGHFVVAGNTFLTVLHADEITSEISWVNQERMHECSIDYSISKLFSVIKSKCAEDLSLSLFILTREVVLFVTLSVSSKKKRRDFSIAQFLLKRDYRESMTHSSSSNSPRPRSSIVISMTTVIVLGTMERLRLISWRHLTMVDS